MLGLDTVGAGLELHGSVPPAFLLGAGWGAVAGALVACTSGGPVDVPPPTDLAPPTDRAGRVRGHTEPLGQYPDRPSGYPGPPGERPEPPDGQYPDLPGPYRPTPAHRPPDADTNPYMRPLPGDARRPPADPETWATPAPPADPPPDEPPPPGRPRRPGPRA